MYCERCTRAPETFPALVCRIPYAPARGPSHSKDRSPAAQVRNDFTPRNTPLEREDQAPGTTKEGPQLLCLSRPGGKRFRGPFR